MSLTGEKAILAAIKAGEVLSPVLIYGSEEYLKQSYLELLIPSESGGFSSFNNVVLDFAGLDMTVLADSLQTPPLMAERKSVLVYDVSPKEVTADITKRLTALLGERYDDCMVVFLEKSGTIDDKRDEKSKKLIKLFEKLGTVIAARERTESELLKMLQRDTKSGGGISTAAAKLVLERCGRDILAIKSESAKLLAYCGGREIVEEDVMALVSTPAQDDIYGLSKAILRGDYNGAMEVLSGLFALRYPTESILGTLSQVYIDLYRAKKAGRRGAAEIAADFSYGKRTFVVENAMRDGRRLTEGYIVYALDVLAVADERLKSTGNDGRTVIEWAVTALFLKDAVFSGGQE